MLHPTSTLLQLFNAFQPLLIGTFSTSMKSTKLWRAIMKKLNVFSYTAFALLPLLFASSSSAAAMDPTLERALVKICVAAASDKPVKLKNAIADYNLTEYKVALNLMCNNLDVISFAEAHNATKNAARLQSTVGGVDIIDVAAIAKINVNF